jgi:hypothetical protein
LLNSQLMTLTGVTAWQGPVFMIAYEVCITQ